MKAFLNRQLWTQIAKYHEGKPYLYKHRVGEESEVIFSTYQIKINLLTYMKGYIAKKIRIIGIPLSISEKGYHFKSEVGKTHFVDWVRGQRGFTVVLNGEDDLGDAFTKVYTLPTICLDNTFESFQDYKNQLRAHYRYRVHKALKAFKTVEVRRNPQFTEEMYRLYEAVFEKSDYKLDKCSYDYFRAMEAELDVFYDQDKLLGFCQYKIVEGTLHFLFCGMAYDYLTHYDTYYNMLLYMLQRGIEEKVKAINFGQTTETIKQKLGGTMRPRYMYIYHSWRSIRQMVKWLAPTVGYKMPREVYHVFKEVRQDESTAHKAKSQEAAF